MSTKVKVHLALGLVLQLATFMAKDTSWLGWCPATLQPVVVAAAQLVAAGVAWYTAESNPAPSALVVGIRRARGRV